MYFINLDTSDDRATALRKNVASLPHDLQTKVELHRVPAVTVTEVEELVENDGLYFKGGVRLTHGARSYDDIKTYRYHEVACTLSHLKAIQQAYIDGHEMVMILEDDAVITKDLMENWESYADVAPSDWQILQWTARNIPFNKRALYHHNDYWVAWRPYFWSTISYTIRREGMKRVLDTSLTKTPTDDGKYVTKWIFSEPDEVTADSYIYLLARNTYTATYPWVVQSTSATTMGDHHVGKKIDFKFGRPDELPPMLSRGYLKNIRRPETVAVVMNVRLKDEADATDEINRLKLDIEEFSKHHSNSCWYINIVMVKEDLKSYVEGMIASWSFSSVSVNLDMSVCEHRFNKFAFLKKVLDDLSSYEYILLKDNDIQLAGFEWNTFMDIKGSSIVAGAFYESVEEWLWRTRFERNNIERRVDFQQSSLFNAFHDEGYTSLTPIPTMLLEMRFVLMRSDFATWFFSQVLTQDFIDQDIDWGPDLMWCGAAYEFRRAIHGNHYSRIPCSLVPINIIHRDTKQIAKDDDDYTIKGNRIIDKFRTNPKFSRWIDGSMPLRPHRRFHEDVRETCEKIDSEMNMNQCGILFAETTLYQWEKDLIND